MLHKYFKTILLLTVLLQASPKPYQWYGKQMEAFQKDCITYQKLTLVPKYIKTKCKVYNSELSRAFKYGYKLDPYVDNDNIDEDKVEKYISYLNALEVKKDNIVESIKYQMNKARTQDNVNYYYQLITSNDIKLEMKDYHFMEKHNSKFTKYPKYIRYKEELEQKQIRDKEILKQKQIKDKEELEQKQKLLERRKEEDAKNLEKAIQSFKKEDEIIAQEEERKEKERKVKHLKENQERERYLKEKKALNESLGIKEKSIQELRKEHNIVKKERIRKASTQEACLGYLQAMNRIMSEDDARIKPIELVSKAALQSTNKSIIAMKKALVYANKYKKYNCRRFSKTDQKSSSQNNYPTIIMSNCKEKWGTNYRMIKYCADEQAKSLDKINNIPNGIIKKECENKWGTNYRMIKYCIDEQTEAKKSLGL